MKSHQGRANTWLAIQHPMPPSVYTPYTPVYPVWVQGIPGRLKWAKPEIVLIIDEIYIARERERERDGGAPSQMSHQTE